MNEQADRLSHHFLCFLFPLLKRSVSGHERTISSSQWNSISELRGCSLSVIMERSSLEKDMNVISGFSKIPLFGWGRFPERCSMWAICFSALEWWLMKYHGLASSELPWLDHQSAFPPPLETDKTNFGADSFTDSSRFRKNTLICFE